MPLTAPRFVKNQRLQKASNNQPPLSMGETSKGVRDLQQALIDLGFDMPISTHRGSKPPDGIFGNETKSKLIAFQKKQGLVADGVAGKHTLEQLDKIFLANDPFFTDPTLARLQLLHQMTGPESSRPFGWTTDRKDLGKA